MIDDVAGIPALLGPGPVRSTLDRLHAEARVDRKHALAALPFLTWAVVTRKDLTTALTPKRLSRAYLPVSREVGRFLYVLARMTGARTIVEFGSSFGISTIYLAAAARENGGTVVTTEIEPPKCRATESNLRQAGLDDVVRVLEGDALRTLSSFGEPIDLLFLDGWKDLYLPVTELLRPRLRPNGVVVADNAAFRGAGPYLDYVRAPKSGFVTTTLFNGTLALSLVNADNTLPHDPPP